MNSKGKFIAKYKTSLLSTGASTLDNLLNGGLPVNTITLLEMSGGMEIDCFILNQLFISHGLCNSQETALVIDQLSGESYLQKLPGNTNLKASSQPITDNLSDLNIAWRYKSLPRIDRNIHSGGEPCNVIDSSKLTSHFVLKERLSDNLDDVLKFCEKFLKEKGGNRRQTRILIGSLGSSLWGSCNSHQEMITLIYRFLFCLNRLFSPQTAVVVMVTLSGLAQFDEVSPQWTSLHSLCGYVLRFEATSDQEQLTSDPQEKITGMLLPIKVPSINSIEPILRPNTVLWSFHTFNSRGKMVFKEFSLPPCLDDKVSRTSQNEVFKTINTHKNGCGVDF